ncbi:MAG: hypothetical protein AB7G25_07530 [Sphingomonadaceae bacterium]
MTALRIDLLSGGVSMAENAFFFYGLLAAFVFGSMRRNHKLGRPHIRQLVVAAWALFAISLVAATYLSIAALGEALQAV